MKAQELTTQISRLTIDIPTELHCIIKAHATLESNSIKDYVLDALKKKIQGEAKQKSGSKVTAKSKLKKTLSKRTASILSNLNKAQKVTFKDTDSAMKYLVK
jgi:hypothetical protein